MAALSPIRTLNTHYTQRKFFKEQDWKAYAAWLRQRMQVSLALLPEPSRTPLKARVFGKWTGNGYTCEKVYFESLPGFYVTGNLFRPADKPRRKLAGILCPHGHWSDGRLHDRDPRGTIILRCINLARMGAVVFSYDMVGYNDACQLPHGTFVDDPHWGLSLMALQTWNSIRSVDFLLSLPEVDPKRIAATGTSGGGTQTFILSALDARVAVSAPICMISLHMQGGCLCENAPLLRIDATNVDIGRLSAPRPVFLGSCTKDWTKFTKQEELPAIRAVYNMYGAKNCLMNHHIDAEHGYNRELREHVYGFLNRFLFGAKTANPLKEIEYERPPHPDRMVWWGRPAPEPISTAVFHRLWRGRIEQALHQPLQNADSARRLLGPLLPHVLGVALDSVADYSRRKPVTIRVEESETALTILPIKTLPCRNKAIKFYDTYNRSPFADQVHEILGVLARRPDKVALCGIGEAGLPCLAAAALSPQVKSVEADLRHFDPGRDSHWVRYLDVPSIRQIGGLATILALIGNRPLRLTNTTASVMALTKRFAK